MVRAQPANTQPLVGQVATTEGLGDWAIRFDYQAGGVSKAPQGSRDHFRAYRLELVRETDGSAEWHHSYRFPSYGVGVHVGDFGSEPTEPGTPVSVYSFLQVPLFPITGTTDVLSNMAVGVTHGWHAPGPEEDPFSKRPTGSTTAYIDLGFYVRQRLSRRLDVIGGFSITHFSNGGMRLPNVGVTAMAPRLAVQYSLGDRGLRRDRAARSPFDAHWVTRVDGGMGINGVGLVWTGETHTPRGTLAMGIGKGSVWRRFHRNGQVGGGLEVSFERNRVPGEAESPDADLSGGASVGAYTGYEQLFGPMSVYAHVGAYLTRTRAEERPVDYQRVGAIYRFSEHWFVDLGLRFHGFSSDDFVEWAVGYRLRSLPFRR